jgi:hypothetical protein
MAVIFFWCYLLKAARPEQLLDKVPAGPGVLPSSEGFLLFFSFSFT